MEYVNPELHRHYQEEMEKMFKQEISGIYRFGSWAKNLFLLVFGLALILSALFNQPITLPFFGRWLWGLSGVFTLGIALIGMRIGLKKTVDLRKDSKFIALAGSSGMIVIAFAVLLVAFLTRDLQSFAVLVPHALLIII